MTHKEYADSLRAIADFFEQHEEVPLPHDAHNFDYYSANTREAMATVATALGSCAKRLIADSTLFALERPFGNVAFRAIAIRENVCKRVVTGKKFVPSRIIPAMPERVVPAEEVDIIEWRCDEPLLSETVKTVEVPDAEGENIPF